VGNTRIKWAVMEGAAMGDLQAADYGQDHLQELLESRWQGLPVPQQVCVANVCGAAVAETISSYTGDHWQLVPVYARVQQVACGVTNAYRDITQLGIDRWLAVIAAWNRYHAPVCVVGCGTAVTVDVVDGNGHHLGGLIFPGLRLMQESLVARTHGIAVKEYGELSLELGDSTSTCIVNGSACALISAIDRVSVDMKNRFGDGLYRVITGGDAAAVNELLHVKFIPVPDLVLQGLAITTENIV